MELLAEFRRSRMSPVCEATALIIIAMLVVPAAVMRTPGDTSLLGFNLMELANSPMGTFRLNPPELSSIRVVPAVLKDMAVKEPPSSPILYKVALSEYFIWISSAVAPANVLPTRPIPGGDVGTVGFVPTA